MVTKSFYEPSYVALPRRCQPRLRIKRQIEQINANMSHTPAASTSSGGNSEHFAEFSTHNASPTHNTQFFLKCVSLSENLFQIMFLYVLFFYCYCIFPDIL